MDVFLAPRFAPASTVQHRPIKGKGGVAVADSSLAPGFAATPTSPKSLRKQATARRQARVTGVASLLLPPRLPRTSVTPMEEWGGTGSAGWTRRWGGGGAEHVAPPHCPGHSHRKSPMDQGTVPARSGTPTSLGQASFHATMQSHSHTDPRDIAPWSLCGHLQRHSCATMAMARREIAVIPCLSISRPVRRGWRTPEAEGRQRRRIMATMKGLMTLDADG